MGIFTKQVNKNETPAKTKTVGKNKKLKLKIFLLLFFALFAGFLVYPNAWNKGADWLNKTTGAKIIPHFFNIPFKLGLDLQGGTHLVYKADLSNIEKGDRNEAMQGVRDVIERRINIFGVSEPVVQVNKSGSDYRLIVELAGIKNVNQAINMIGETPSLIFKSPKPEEEAQKIQEQQKEISEKLKQNEELSEEEKTIFRQDPRFEPTNLTGRYLEDAQVQFDQTTGKPYVGLKFNSEGADIFEELTREHKGEQIAIYLDGYPISAPEVQDVITGGRAQISGNFSLQEAKELVQRLNAGALPVPINLINQQTIGASLGKDSLDKSLEAAFWGFVMLLAFIIVFYRLP